jgi:hypothetical protein
MPPALFCFSYFLFFIICFSHFCLGLVLDCEPSDFCLLNTWDCSMSCCVWLRMTPDIFLRMQYCYSLLPCHIGFFPVVSVCLHYDSLMSWAREPMWKLTHLPSVPILTVHLCTGKCLQCVTGPSRNTVR